MTERTENKECLHTLILTKRERVEITGVCEVESFDDTLVRLVTDCGDLTLEGEELHVDTLDVERGLVEIGGLVGGLYYSDSAGERRKGRRRQPR
jgi:sporulation protein YabP